MKVLVTGASGFLGRAVVRSLTESGHTVRALVRRATTNEACGFAEGVEIVKCDLRSAKPPALEAVLDGQEAVIHLAASMSGNDVNRFTDTAVGTERLFDAMAATEQPSGEKKPWRLILCSSFTVYDWASAGRDPDESVSVHARPYHSGYTTAKVWQERLAGRAAAAYGWQLTVLRPGFIWGKGNELPAASVGRDLGPIRWVFGAGRQPCYAHVDNTADCFRAALENPDSIGESLNVIDGHGITAWRFLGEHMERAGERGFRVPIPTPLLRAGVAAMRQLSLWIFGDRAKLPSFFKAEEFAEVYEPRDYRTDRLRQVLSNHRPLGYEACLERTYAAS